MKNPFKNSKESNVGNSPKVEKDSKNSKGKPKKNSIIYFFKFSFKALSFSASSFIKNFNFSSTSLSTKKEKYLVYT